MGEAMRTEQAAKIYFGDTFASHLVAAIWRHDPQRGDVTEGGFVLRERLVFTIRKVIQPTVFEAGTIIRCDITGNKAFIVETITQITTDHIAWRYEARRAPGSDPS